MKSKHSKSPAERVVKDIRRATRKQYSAEEKIRIVLEVLRGDDSIAELCRQEGISQGVYYKWSKDFMEAGKRRLACDTSRAANSDDVRDLRREARDLKEVVVKQMLENRLLKAQAAAIPGHCPKPSHNRVWGGCTYRRCWMITRAKSLHGKRSWPKAQPVHDDAR